MTNDDYRRLIEFLGRQFTEVDAGFEEIKGLIRVRRLEEE